MYKSYSQAENCLIFKSVSFQTQGRNRINIHCIVSTGVLVEEGPRNPQTNYNRVHTKMYTDERKGLFFAHPSKHASPGKVYSLLSEKLMWQIHIEWREGQGECMGGPKNTPNCHVQKLVN